MRDSNDKSDVKTLTITAGNTSPTVTLDIPVEGDFFDWGEPIPYEVTVTDPEDATIDCDRVVVTFVLNHDEHGHNGATQQGCTGVFATNPEDANHGGSVAAAIVATYTDLGANGQPALTDSDQRMVNQRRQEVEFVFEQVGTNTAVTNDPDGGGTHRGSLGNGDWIALNRSYFLGNMDKKIRFRFAGGAGNNPEGADRMNVEIREGSPTGDLITTVTIKSTGSTNNWSTQEFDLDFVGSQRLYLVFRQIPGGPASGFFGWGSLNWVEFTGPGVSADLP